MDDETRAEGAAGDEPVVIEDSEAEQERKRELEERLAAQGGVEPTEPEPETRAAPSGSPATMVAEARTHIGYREQGENDTMFNRWLGPIGGYPAGGFGYPWCHAFVSYCLWHSGNGGAGPRTAGCTTGVSWFKSANRWFSSPQVGDLVYYGPGGGTHVELVTGVGPGTITTIGGNTSGSFGGSYFNGDGVYEKTVDRTSSRIAGYGRPSYGSAALPADGGGGGGGGGGTGGGGASTVTPITSIRTVAQQQQAVNGLGYTPKLDVDGDWGPKTEAGVKWLQQKVGADVDGQWGRDTERLYRAFTKT